MFYLGLEFQTMASTTCFADENIQRYTLNRLVGSARFGTPPRRRPLTPLRSPSTATHQMPTGRDIVAGLEQLGLRAATQDA